MTVGRGQGILGWRFALDSGAVPGQLRALSALFGLAGGAGLAAAIKEATDAAARFETQLARVSTLLGPGEDAITRFGSAVNEMAIKFGQSTDVVADALFQTISASVDAGDAVEFLGNVAGKAAVGGFTDMKTSVDGITNVLNAYGLSVQSAKDVSDAFFVANIRGKTTFEELARTVGNVAPTAQKAGLSFEELFSALATGTKVGLRTSTVVDSLRTALAATFKPSEQAVKLAEELNIQFDESAIRTKGFAAFLEELTLKTGGSAEKLSTLFGSVEASNVIMALTTEQGLAGFRQALADMGQDISTTEDAFSKATNTFEYKARRIKEAVGRSFRSAGEEVIKGLVGDLNTFEARAAGLEEVVRKSTRLMVDSFKWAADNIWEIASVVLLGKVGGALSSLATRMQLASGAAAGNGAGVTAVGAGRFATGIGAVTLIAQSVIIGKEVGEALGRAIAEYENRGERAAAAASKKDASLAARLVASGLFDQTAFLGRGEDPLTNLVANLQWSPDSTRGSLAGLTATEREAALREASALAGFEVSTEEQFSRLQDFLMTELRQRAPRLSGGYVETRSEDTAALRNLLGNTFGDALDAYAQSLGLSGEFRNRVGGAYAPSIESALGAAGSRTQEMGRQERRYAERLRDVAVRDGAWEAVKQAIADPFDSLAETLNGQGEIDPNGLRSALAASTDLVGDGILDAFDVVVGMFSPVVSGMQAAAEEMKPGAITLLHLIKDFKPKRKHSISLQKRGQAKGLPPRYTALVLREGYGAAVVEPLPEHTVDVGLGRGTF